MYISKFIFLLKGSLFSYALFCDYFFQTEIELFKIRLTDIFSIEKYKYYNTSLGLNYQVNTNLCLEVSYWNSFQRRIPSFVSHLVFRNLCA